MANRPHRKATRRPTEPADSPNEPVPTDEPYHLRISRLTIDKLGVKLYDKVSAVVAELIANSFDADATSVQIELPLGTELATKQASGAPADKGYSIVVRDNGHGMTPNEARDFYLDIGRDRRKHKEQGARSRTKGRPVMGRKGIGKLAPFGICRRIEVISSGGNPVKGGYITSHFYMDFDQIMQDTDEDVPLDSGPQNGTLQPHAGTTIVLTRFLSKRVPDSETFHRQLAARFVVLDDDFKILVRDTRKTPPIDSTLERSQIDVMAETQIDVANEPIVVAGESLPVTGWLALAREAYKHEELAGVRIYARGKIVATTRDFEQPAGFTGEFTMRSYLVGEIHADWLDDDAGDDLIRTDRQSILWDSERGEALREWGASLIKRIGAMSRAPRREKKSTIFIERARFRERASERFGDAEVEEVAVELAQKIGAFAAEDELADEDYVNDLAEFIFSIAPQYALVEAFREISNQPDIPFDQLIALFGKARVAELASYAQLADQRVKSISKLQATINTPGVDEAELQELIAQAPWLIHADWSVITENRSLKTFRDQFVVYFKKRFGEDIDIAISHERKRPDFTLIHHGRKLHVVELKRPGHTFQSDDYGRLENYVVALEQFWKENTYMVGAFPDGWEIDLIADAVNLSDQTQTIAFSSLESRRLVIRKPWDDFLAAAVEANAQFLNVYDEARKLEGSQAT